VRLPWLAHDEAPGPYVMIPQYWFNKTKQHTHSGPGHDLAGIALRPTSFLCPSRRWEKGEPGELAT